MGMLEKFDFVRRRYARKFALMALVIVVITAGIGLFTQQEVSGKVTDQKQAEVQTSAQLEANALGQWLEGSKQQVRTLSNHAGLQSEDTAAIESTLNAELEEMPKEVVALHYVQRGEVPIVDASTDSSMAGANLSKTVFWNPNVGYNFDGTDSVLESFVNITPDGRGSFVALGSPVPNSDHAVVATLRTDVRAQDFSSSIEGTRTVTIGGFTGLVLFAEDSEILLDSYQGKRVINDTASESVNTKLEERATGAPDERSKQGSFVTDEHVVGYASVPGTDWVTVKEAPKKKALAVKQNIEGSLLLLIGSSLGGLFLLGGLITVGPMRSLRKLSTQARAIAKGDLSQEIPDTRRVDEVGQVQKSFQETKDYLDTVADQADALAQQDFDADILEEEVPGRLGESHETMRQDLQEAFDEVQRAREQAEKRRNHLQEKAEAYSVAMRETAEGDLTQRLDPESDSEAMTDIAEEFNEMVENIEAIIERLNAFADEVAAASEEVTASSEEVQAASQRVSKSIQQISDGADQQNDSLQSVQEEMQSLSSTTDEIAASSDEVAEIAERTAEEGRKGREAAQEAVDGMAELETGAGEAVSAIEALESEMEQIDELTEFISGVAKQTDMLALNANIEASRGSGEDGEDEGFGAVAQEVKELAEETQEAVGDIEQRLERIQNRTDETAVEIQKTADQVTEHTESVREAVDALDEIAGYAEETNTGVQEINATAQQQAASTQEVVAMVDEAASISENTSLASESVAAAAEEQTTAMTDVSDSASALSEQASQLSAALDQFDTAAESDLGTEDDLDPEDAEPTTSDDSGGEPDTSGAEGE